MKFIGEDDSVILDLCNNDPQLKICLIQHSVSFSILAHISTHSVLKHSFTAVKSI